MSTKVNLAYVETKRKEMKETKIIMKELCRLMNDYCTIVTGQAKRHILLEEVFKMFPNIEVIDFTIEYALNCLEGLSEDEKHYILSIIYQLKKLRKIKINTIPF